jgi:hypothetical protein
VKVGGRDLAVGREGQQLDLGSHFPLAFSVRHLAFGIYFLPSSRAGFPACLSLVPC